jgi:hypothetical protein
MSMVRRRVLAAVVLAFVCARADSAQAPDTTHKHVRVIGVFDSRSGEPVGGVQVLDVFSGSYAITSPSGAAPLSFVTFKGSAGVLELRKLGYQAKQVMVSSTDTMPITEILEPVVTLAPVVTTEKYRVDRDAGKWDGFEQRCTSKGVTCVRTEELERRPIANLADFLIHADGVTMGGCGGGSGKWMANRNGQCGKIAMRSSTIPPSYCEPTFFIDGFEWNSKLGAAADMTPGRPAEAPYVPSNVKAMEVYPTGGPRPMRFEGNPQCGAVVIWTK